MLHDLVGPVARLCVGRCFATRTGSDMASSGFGDPAEGCTIRWRKVAAVAWMAVFLAAAMTVVETPRAAPAPLAIPLSLPPPPSLEPVPLVPPPAAWTFLGNRAENLSGHGFVYDSKADLFILFGGQNETGGSRNSTWSYDYNTNTWTNITPVVSPSPQFVSGMVYDSHADRVILFGESNDTWAFDLANDTWTRRSPAVAPAALLGPAMTYDAGADRTILYGVDRGEWAQTWAYDYAADTWTKKAPGPGLLRYSSMTYDPSAGRDILFGGYYPGRFFLPIYVDGTWSYDFANDSWTNRNPPIHPSARADSAFSFDSRIGKAILFGGTNQVGKWGSALNETWAYNYAQNNWTSVTPAVAPSGRTGAAMDFDPVAGVTVLVGGSIYLGWAARYNDTWAYRYGAVPPAPPRILGASPGANCITLTWQAPPSDGGSAVTNYSVYRSEGSGHENLLATLGNVLSYVDTNVTIGTTEYYVVTAINAVGEGPSSEEVSAAPATAPSPPQDLAAAGGAHVIDLTWLAPASTGGSAPTGYKVYRSQTSGHESFLAQVGLAPTFADWSVVDGWTYYYRVSAVNNVGESPWSNEASSTPLTTPSAPLGLAADATDATVTLTWQTPLSTGGEDIAGYRVYRGSSTGTETLLAKTGLVLTFADNSVANAHTYYYQVSAVNLMGEGPMSNVASATLPPEQDFTPPAIAFTYPMANAVLTSTVTTATGTASDNVAIQKIELSTDEANWTMASGTTSWSGSLTLHEGPNTIFARATDTSGNAYEVSTPVTVEIPGPPPPTQGPQGPDPALLGGLVIVVVATCLGAASVLWKHRGLRRELETAEAKLPDPGLGRSRQG